MSQPYQFIKQSQQAVLRLQTQWLNADLIPATPITPENTAVLDAIRASIDAWQARGYVIEDACVLALFAHASQKMHGESSLNNSLTKHDAYPRLMDLACGPRPSLAFPAMTDPRPGIYPIVDNLEHLAAMLGAGARILQLRIKSTSLTPQISRQIRQAVMMSRDYPHCQLFINDYWQAAIDEGAWGVHLGQEDLLPADLDAIAKAGLRLGVSSHAFWEVARALTIKPSIVACGPVFPTRVKAMPWIAQGTDNLRYWVNLIPYPVIGIGGVNTDNLSQIHATGCASASVIAAITTDPNPGQAFRKLQAQWHALEEQTVAKPSPVQLAKPTLAIS